MSGTNPLQLARPLRMSLLGDTLGWSRELNKTLSFQKAKDMTEITEAGLAIAAQPATLTGLQREIAGIIIRDVLQEDQDDLVEGYFDEIMQAAKRIALLPAYNVVARAFETNAAEHMLKAAAECTRLQEEVKGLAGFATAALDCLWDGYAMDGSDIQDAALQHGLIVQTTFDPNIHSDRHGVGAEDGDKWFVPAPWLVALQGQQS